MARYIDAEKVKHDVLSLFRRNKVLIDEWLVYCVEDVIDDQPTADVRENVHAHWVVLEDEIGLYGCSNCEHKILRKMTNYCPNCGAQMGERRTDDAEIH